MQQLRTEGIVFRNFKLSEADRIIKILTKEYAVISAVAKGARKSTSSISAKTQTMVEADFLLAKGKNLFIITEASVINNFADDYNNLFSINLAYYVLEISEYLSADIDSAKNLYSIVQNFLNKLKIIDQSSKLNNEIKQKDLLLVKRNPEVNSLVSNVINSIDEKDIKIHKLLEEREDKELIEIMLGMETLWIFCLEFGYKPELNICTISNKKRSLRQVPRFFDLNNGGICSQKAYVAKMNDEFQDDYKILPMTADCFKIFMLLDEATSTYFTNSSLTYSLNDLILAGDFFERLSYRKIKKALSQGFRILAKHLEIQIHKECKSFRGLEELLDLS